MIQLFRKSKPAVQVLTKTPQQPQSVRDTIEEIHRTFYTEVERLIAEAKIPVSTETRLQKLIDKRERLIKLGFEKTKEVKNAGREIERLENAERENQLKLKQIRAIEYFSQKYPPYKFITEESVKRICDKYGLIYGDVANYIGTVPYKNLEAIENFKIKPEDKVYGMQSEYSSSEDEISFSYYKSQIEDKKEVRSTDIGTRIVETSSGSFTNDFFISSPRGSMIISGGGGGGTWGVTGFSGPSFRTSRGDKSIYKNNFYYRELPMEIAAPKSDFDLTDMEVKGSKISKHIPDPIVLQPVMHENTKYYLVVTAWGLEAGDEEVINPINN